MTAQGDKAASRPASLYFIGRTVGGRFPAGGFDGVDMVERANDRAGFHFFSADTLRFFSSRVGGHLYGGRFFVTSERDSGPGLRAWDGERLYSVRFARCDGSIETVGGFGRYASSRAANRAAERAAHLFALRARGGVS